MSSFPLALLAPRTANTNSDLEAVDTPLGRSVRDVKSQVQTSRGAGRIRLASSSVVGGRVKYRREFLQRSPSPWPGLLKQLEALPALDVDWDGYGAPAPAAAAIRAAWTVFRRAFELGVNASAILPSAEGGVFIAFGAGSRRANIECFNNESAYAATLADKVAVWPVSTIDQSDLDGALQRIREHIAPTR